MARVKKGLTKRKRHKKILASTKGYRGAKSRLVRTAKEATLHAGEYAFAGRKQRKRNKRSLWISQVNAAVKNYGITYSQFIKGLKDANIDIDRKILAEIATSDQPAFSQILSKTKIKSKDK
jgi:large subunit ribosomal protein L20